MEEEQVALNRVKGLLKSMSPYNTAEENEQIVAEIKVIAKKYGENEEMQECYAKGLLNLMVAQKNTSDRLLIFDTLFSLKLSNASIIELLPYMLLRLGRLRKQIDNYDKDLISQWQCLLGKCLDLGGDNDFTQDVIMCWEFAKGDINLLEPLFLIWLSIKKILPILTVYYPEELLRNNPLAHYTRADSLKYFMVSNENYFESKCFDLTFEATVNNLRLRLNNADYMNDPQEGKTLLEHLGVTDVQRGEGVLLNEVSPVFFTSFTTSTDSLPMWSQYTGNAQGVALLFKENFFNAKPWSIIDSLKPEMKQLSSEDTSKRTEIDASSSDGYLYHVCYIAEDDGVQIPTKDNNPNELKELRTEIKEIKSNIQELHKIFPKNDEKRIELDRTILALLDDIRYLFKSADYAYEHELRLVRFLHMGSDAIKQFKTDSMALPKLYVEYDKNIIHNIKEIKLGPKFENAHSVVPYIQHLNARIRKKNPITITRSKIDFR